MELLLLRIRSLIASKEFATASANRELQALGEWCCDWGKVQIEIAEEIDTLMEKAERALIDSTRKG